MIFEQRVLQFIEKNKLMPARGLVLLGVSGGADSMALLLVLSRLRHHLGVQLRAVHFNHRFRPQAVSDERFVAKWCAHLNVPLVIGRRPGGKLKHLPEDKARRMRFGFFFKTARKLQAQSVALAHSQNDLAETVMMRLMRGSGLYGLSAIRVRRIIEGVVFTRPLLDVTRADIESYLKANKIPYRMDATNLQPVYERNRVRLELLPLLAREYNPQIIDALSDLAVTAGDDYEFLFKQAGRIFDRIAVVEKNKIKVKAKDLQRQPAAIRRMIFRQMAGHLTGEPAVLTFEHIKALENFLFLEGSGRVDLPRSLRAVKDKENLEIHAA